MRAKVKLHSRGIIVIPKALREAISLKEGETLMAEVREGAIVLRPLRPRRVRLGGKIREIVRELKEEERMLEG